MANKEQDLNIPGMPRIAMETLSLFTDKEPNVRMISRSLGRDIGLSSRILVLANSAYFGGQGSTSDMIQAIGRIGLDSLRQLLITHAVHDSFAMNSTVPGFEWDLLWEHCSLTGQIGYRLARKISPNFISDVHIAGLLHDAGFFLLGKQNPEQLLTLAEYVRTGGLHLAKAERNLGIAPHAEIGARLAQAWNLPPRVALLIAQHEGEMPVRDNNAPENQRLINLIRLANLLALRYGVHPEIFGSEVHVEESLIESVGVDGDVLANVVKSSLMYLNGTAAAE